MIFFRTAMILLAATSFSARDATAQPLRAFDNSASHRALQTTPPAITTVAVSRPVTDEIETTFTHIPLASGHSVGRSYFTAGCNTPLTLDGTGYETLALAAEGGAESKVTNKISQIYDDVTVTPITPFVPPVALATATRGEQFTYCVRLTYNTPAGIADFREVDITYKAYFDEDTPLGGTVSGSSVVPDDGVVNSDLLTISAFACASPGGSPIPSPLTITEGNQQRFCVKADQHPTTGMVRINTFTFSGTPQEHNSAITQNAITATSGADALTTIETCTLGAQFCAFSTILKGEFYQKPNGSRVTMNTVISGSGTATIRIGGTTRKARILLMLRPGDEVVKETSKVEFMAEPKDEKKGCDCSGTFFLFKIFCWIFRCLLGF